MTDFWAASPVLLAALLSSALIFWSLGRRNQHGALVFAALMAALTIWSVSYWLELMSLSLRAKLFWNLFKFFGVNFAGPLWLMFALIYTEREHWLTRRNRVLLLLPGVLGLLFVVTQRWHGQWILEPKLAVSGPFLLIDSGEGLLFWVNTVMAYTMILAGVALYLLAFIHAPRLYRRQTAVMLFGALIPLIGNVVYLSGLTPGFHELDITPILLSMTGLLVAFGAFRFRLLEVMPVARSLVVDNMTDAVIVVDRANRVLDMNPRARELAGLKRRGLIGRQLKQVLADCPHIDALLAKLAEVEDRPVSFQITCSEWDMIAGVTISPVMDAHETLMGQLITIRDITTQMQATAEIRRLKEFNETIIQNMLEGIAIEDQDGVITYANPGAHRILGFPEGELLGKQTEALLDAAELDRLRNELQERRQGRQARYQTVMITKGGQPVHVQVSALPMFRDRKFQGVLSVLTDISNQVRLEDAQRSMIAMTSHDLRNPLQVMKGYLDMVLQEPTLDVATRQEFLLAARKATVRMQQLTDGLLDLARIEAGEWPMDTERLSPQQLLAGVVA